MNGGPPPLGLLLHDAARALRKRFEARTGTLGLSSAQWRLLILVSREPGLSQSRFADALDIEPISVSRLVDRMVTGGWVARVTDPKDRRAKLLQPTPKALATYSQVKTLAEGVYAEALTGLTAAETATILKGLTLIIANLAQPAVPDCASPELD